MATALISIDIEARLANLESGITKASAITRKFGDDIERVGRGSGGRGVFDGVADSARRASFQNQQLSYQLNDFFVQVTSGQSPLTAFIQQGSQLSGTFGGAVPAMKGVLSLLTPMNVALGASALAVGGLAYAWHKGTQESEAFSKSLALTGNYAGLTADKFNALALSTSTSTQTHIGAARDILQGFVSTGQLSGQALGAVSEAALTLQKNTGASADEVVKDFAKMTDGVYKWAEEHNKQYHFLTAAELEHIRRLEEEGDKTNAYIVVASALNDHLKNQNTNVGLLAGTWRAFGEAAATAWDKLKNIGRDRTIGEQIADLRKQLDSGATGIVGADATVIEQSGQDRIAIQKKIAFLERAQGVFEHTVTLQAKKKQDEESLHQDNEFLRKEEERFRTNADKRAKEIAKINKVADDAIAKGGEFSAERRAKLIANVEETYKDKKPAAGPKDDPTKSLLSNRLKEYEHSIGEEKDMLAAFNRYTDLYYSENLISISTYYDARKQRSAEALKLQLANYDAEIAALESYRARAGKATDRADAEGKIADLIDKKRKLQQAASEEGVVGAIKEAKAYRDLQDQLDDLDGALQRLAGHQADAAGAAFDKQYRTLKARLTAQEDAISLGKLDTLRTQTVAQGELNDKNSDAALIYEHLRNVEEQISISRQLGQTSELGALRQLGEARQSSVRELEAILRAQEAIAQASGSPKMLLEAEKARLEFERLRASADVLGDHMRTLFEGDLSSSLSTFFDDLAAGKNVIDSLKKAFSNFAASVLRDISNIAAKQLAASLFRTGTPGGNAAGLIGNLFAGFGGAAAGGAATAGTAVAGVGYSAPTGDALSFLFDAVQGAATGGDVTPGWLMVGERGRELIRTDGARVYNNRDTERMLGAATQKAGDTNHNYIINVSPPAGTDRRTALQWGETIGQSIRSSGRNS